MIGAMTLLIIFIGLPAFFFLGLAVFVLYANIFHDAGCSTGMIAGPLVIGLSLVLIGYSLMISGGSSSTAKNEKIICQVCDREFQKGSENAKSIRKTNMCTQCYQNYKNASDYLNELPIN